MDVIWLSRPSVEIATAYDHGYVISDHVLAQIDADFGFLPQTMTIDAVLDEV